MKNKKDDKVTIWVIGGVLLLAIIIIITVIIINSKPVDKKPSGNDKVNPPIENKTKITEKDIIDKYGNSIKDAEEAALKFFNSNEGYECSTKISEDELYIVTVTDTYDNSKYVFEVDPATLNAVLK